MPDGRLPGACPPVPGASVGSEDTVKTIGIVGGLAWPSSAIYYRTINELVARRLGGLHCARLVLAQTDFEQVERYQREGAH